MNAPSSHTWLALILLVTGMTACGKAVDGERSVERSTQKISALEEEDQERLRQQRSVVLRFAADTDENRKKLLTAAGKLGLIQNILDAGIFKPEQTYELQCLGIMLGDTLVQELQMEWIMVEDEYGRDPAVQLPNTSIILFPLTMISKRVECGEAVDVFELFNWLAGEVERLADEGA